MECKIWGMTVVLRRTGAGQMTTPTVIRGSLLEHQMGGGGRVTAVLGEMDITRVIRFNCEGRAEETGAHTGTSSGHQLSNAAQCPSHTRWATSTRAGVTRALVDGW